MSAQFERPPLKTSGHPLIVGRLEMWDDECSAQAATGPSRTRFFKFGALANETRNWASSGTPNLADSGLIAELVELGP